MIFLILDIFLSFFSDIPTFFVLLNILTFSKEKLFSFLLIPLVLDLFILNTYFFNTVLFFLFFLIIKHLKITKVNFGHFLLLSSFLYFGYVFSLGFLKGYGILYLFTFVFSNYIFHLIFYILCYKILKPYIKLSR